MVAGHHVQAPCNDQQPIGKRIFEDKKIERIAAVAAKMEPRDTIRVKAIATAKTARAPRAAGQASANITPSPTATDLPPENFSQTERLVPDQCCKSRHGHSPGLHAWPLSQSGGTIDKEVISDRTRTIAATPEDIDEQNPEGRPLPENTQSIRRTYGP